MFELSALSPKINITIVAPGPIVSNVGKHAILDDVSQVGRIVYAYLTYLQ